MLNTTVINGKSLSKEEKQKESETAKQIIRFFYNRTAIEFSLLWEKVISYFVLTKDTKSLNVFTEKIRNQINKLKWSNSNIQINIEELRKDLMSELDLAISMSVALSFDRIDNVDYNNEAIIKNAKLLRTTNLIRHYRIGCGLINYTRNGNNTADLFSDYSNITSITECKPNLLFWLSPRYITLGEISCYLMMCELCSYSENNDVLKGLHNKTIELYRQFNIEWTGFFGMKSIEYSIPKCFDDFDDINDRKNVQCYDLTDAEIRGMYVNKNLYGTNKNVCLANLKVNGDDLKSCLKKKPNLSINRKINLYRIFDDATKRETKGDLLVFPELSIPAQWKDLLREVSRQRNIGIVSGLEYIIYNGYAFNIVITFLPIQLDKYHKDCVVIPRIKNHYAPGEQSNIVSFGYKIPKHRVYYDFFHWRNSYFSVYNCYEMACIEERALLKSKIDFIVAVEYNPDVNFYSDIIGSWTRDISAYIIQVNTAQYGDSRLIRPTDSASQNLAVIKGGDNPVVIVEQLNIEWLRNEQYKNAKAYLNPISVPPKKRKPVKLKPTPPDFDMDNIIKRMSNNSFISIWNYIFSNIT